MSVDEKSRQKMKGNRERRELHKRPMRDLDHDEVKRHMDALLDAALAATFPASDPVSISYHIRHGAPRR